MIDYGNAIYPIKNNIYFAPYLQTIYETEDNIKINETQLRHWLQDSIDFKFAVQNIINPKYSKAAEILITDKCNLACSYCYSGGYRSSQTIDKKYLAKIVSHLFKNAYITRLYSGKKDTVYILFHGGGEPTQAWDELVYTVEYARELSEKYDVKVKFNLATNGVFFKKQLAFLLDNKFDFRISLDGVEKINDKTRLTAKNISSFPMVSDILDNINKSESKFVIAGVVTNDNIYEMNNFIEYCITRWNNIHDLRFFMLEETELTLKNKIRLLNMEAFQKNLYNGINMMIERKVGKYKKYVSLYDYIIRNHKGCCAPSIMQMPVYNSNGDILRCNAHVFNKKAKIGIFLNGQLIFNEDEYSHLYADIKGKKGQCKNCLCATYCEFGGDSCIEPLEQTESYCKYMKEYFKEILCAVYNNPQLVSTSKTVSRKYPGIKKVVYWDI